jgi:hypothetical protein
VPSNQLHSKYDPTEKATGEDCLLAAPLQLEQSQMTRCSQCKQPFHFAWEDGCTYRSPLEHAGKFLPMLVLSRTDM